MGDKLIKNFKLLKKVVILTVKVQAPVLMVAGIFFGFYIIFRVLHHLCSL